MAVILDKWRAIVNLGALDARFQFQFGTRCYLFGRYFALWIGALFWRSEGISHSDSFHGQIPAAHALGGICDGGFVLKIEAWLEPPRHHWQFVRAAHSSASAGGRVVVGGESLQRILCLLAKVGPPRAAPTTIIRINGISGRLELLAVAALAHFARQFQFRFT
jgi:hypothetical protein